MVAEVEVGDFDVGEAGFDFADPGGGFGAPEDDDHVFGGGAASHCFVYLFVCC